MRHRGLDNLGVWGLGRKNENVVLGEPLVDLFQGTPICSYGEYLGSYTLNPWTRKKTLNPYITLFVCAYFYVYFFWGGSGGGAGRILGVNGRRWSGFSKERFRGYYSGQLFWGFRFIITV